MKIKTLKFLFGVFLVLVVLYAVLGIPLLIVYSWEAALILNVFIVIVFMYLYFANSPRASLHRFYDYTTIRKWKRPIKLHFRYRKKKYEFNCAQSVMGINLEKIDIHMSEDELMKFAGDTDLGTSHWEIESTLNMIYKQKGKPFRARISYYTTCSELERQIVEGHGAIILFHSSFQQKGFTLRATYPHFALVSYISLSKNKVVLVSPSSDHVHHGDNQNEEGEVELSRDDFLHRFYADTRHLKLIEYLPTMISYPYRKRWNQLINLIFRGVFIFAYYTKILKPGIAIITEPTDKK